MSPLQEACGENEKVKNSEGYRKNVTGERITRILASYKPIWAEVELRMTRPMQQQNRKMLI